LTEMVYSSYVLLVHVPYFSHAHNLYLQTAVEQGLPGLAALLCLTGLAARTLLRTRLGSAPALAFQAGALASLVALLVHGMLDSQFYVSQLVPAMFLPLGLAMAFARPRTSGPDS